MAPEANSFGVSNKEKLPKSDFSKSELEFCFFFAMLISSSPFFRDERFDSNLAEDDELYELVKLLDSVLLCWKSEFWFSSEFSFEKLEMSLLLLED